MGSFFKTSLLRHKCDARKEFMNGAAWLQGRYKDPTRACFDEWRWRAKMGNCSLAFADRKNDKNRERAEMKSSPLTKRLSRGEKSDSCRGHFRKMWLVAPSIIVKLKRGTTNRSWCKSQNFTGSNEYINCLKKSSSHTKKFSRGKEATLVRVTFAKRRHLSL